jgi:hypothetical protein
MRRWPLARLPAPFFDEPVFSTVVEPFTAVVPFAVPAARPLRAGPGI